MKVKTTPYILILILFVNFSFLYGQKFQLRATVSHDNNERIFKEISYNQFHDSIEGINNEINSIKSKLELIGFLNASIDTLILVDTTYTAQFLLGKRLKEIRIFFDASDQYKTIDFKKILKPYSKKITNTYIDISFEEVTNLLAFIVNYFEQTGRSFTQISLKNIHIENENAMAELQIFETGSRTIDKVIVNGYEKFPKKYINNDLNLKINTVFNNDKLLNASSAIKNLSFVEELKPPEVLFTDDSTYVYLYLKKKRSNRFDGVIGFSSNEDSDGLNFNGYLDFIFNNLFNGGESVALLWKNNGNNSQRFYVAAEIPYIFKLPIIPKVEFEIFRQDTIYNDVRFNFDLSYLINNKNKITAVLNSESSNNLLKTNDPDLNVSSYSNLFLGGAYTFRILNNDILFPEKFKLNVSVLYGNREAEETKTDQTKFQLIAHYLLSINLKNYIYIQNQSAMLNSENYYNNELFRIGGINTIRGFNEESIFASSYSIFNLEYRFKPSSSSYFFTITDFAYVNDKIIDKTSQIYSLGIGYSFVTKIGLLNVSYAVGKFANQPISLGDSKLHIKLVSIF